MVWYNVSKKYDGRASVRTQQYQHC